MQPCGRHQDVQRALPDGRRASLKATIDASRMPVRLVARPREFGRILSHFQSGQNDITISCSPEGAENGFDDRDLLKTGDERGAAHRNLKLSSYADPNAPRAGASNLRFSRHRRGRRRKLRARRQRPRGRHRQSEGPPRDGCLLRERRFGRRVILRLRGGAGACQANCGVSLARRPARGRCRVRRRARGYDNHHGRYFDAAAADFEAELVLASMLPPGTGEPSETMGGERTEEDGGARGGIRWRGLLSQRTLSQTHVTANSQSAVEGSGDHRRRRVLEYRILSTREISEVARGRPEVREPLKTPVSRGHLVPRWTRRTSLWRRRHPRRKVGSIRKVIVLTAKYREIR